MNDEIRCVTDSLTTSKLTQRIITAFLLFYTLFFLTVIVSYLLLPDGFMRSRNNLTDIELSVSFVPHMLQLLGYNIVGAVLILVFNYWNYQQTRFGRIPIGYFMIGVLFVQNAITLGTWSFTIDSVAPDLAGRLLRQFDLAHRSGFWEMSGLLLIACASCDFAFKRKKRKQKDNAIALAETNEKITMLVGFVLMFCGAFIETWAIVKR